MNLFIHYMFTFESASSFRQETNSDSSSSRVCQAIKLSLAVADDEAIVKRRVANVVTKYHSFGLYMLSFCSGIMTTICTWRFHVSLC